MGSECIFILYGIIQWRKIFHQVPTQYFHLHSSFCISLVNSWQFSFAFFQIFCLFFFSSNCLPLFSYFCRFLKFSCQFLFILSHFLISFFIISFYDFFFSRLSIKYICSSFFIIFRLFFQDFSFIFALFSTILCTFSFIFLPFSS